jgi:tetratricopeptide (TPR) repeat protein
VQIQMKGTASRSAGRSRLLGALGLCLLSTPLLRLGLPQAPGRARGEMPSSAYLLTSRTPRPGRSPADQALWEARGWRGRALLETNQQREALEAWDPEAMESVKAEVWRLQQMACDRSGHLRRARAAAQRGAALARTPLEAYRAAEYLARIEHEAGDHQAELRHAQRLIALAPRNPGSIILLRRAAICNGLDVVVGPAAE